MSKRPSHTQQYLNAIGGIAVPSEPSDRHFFQIGGFRKQVIAALESRFPGHCSRRHYDVFLSGKIVEGTDYWISTALAEKLISAGVCDSLGAAALSRTAREWPVDRLLKEMRERGIPV